MIFHRAVWRYHRLLLQILGLIFLWWQSETVWSWRRSSSTVSAASWPLCLCIALWTNEVLQSLGCTAKKGCADPGEASMSPNQSAPRINMQIGGCVSVKRPHLLQRSVFVFEHSNHSPSHFIPAHTSARHHNVKGWKKQQLSHRFWMSTFSCRLNFQHICISSQLCQTLSS